MYDTKRLPNAATEPVSEALAQSNNFLGRLHCASERLVACRERLRKHQAFTADVVPSLGSPIEISADLRNPRRMRRA
jgi:hypothetical protein